VYGKLRSLHSPQPALVFRTQSGTVADSSASALGAMRLCLKESNVPITDDVRIGNQVKIFHPELVNLYGCTLGDGTRVGAFVEVQKNATVGALCKISSHTFICEGVTIEEEVFIGHGVMFTNDRYPRATNKNGALQTETDWKVEPTLVKARASIGSNVTIMAGVTIGEGALVGAGAVVTTNVPDYAVVAGVPARVIGDARQRLESR
jgi:UDP-2-acetamido-3-amino-2,3-dideoxy-glucuronate N-acetyltransferase